MKRKIAPTSICPAGDYKSHWLGEPDAPLVAFGFGLGRDDTLTIRVRVTNAGNRAGDEVPQLHIRPRVSSTVAGKRLIAYRRVHLAAGANEVVEFAIPAKSLAVLDPEDRWSVEPGEYEVFLGSSSIGDPSGTFSVANATKITVVAAVPLTRKSP